MKKLIALLLICCLSAGVCAGCEKEDAAKSGGERVVAEDGKILLDNIYSCEKIAELEDGGAFRIASVGGKVYFSGWNEEGYDVFSCNGSVTEGHKFGIDGLPQGIGAADGGIAFVLCEWDSDHGYRMMLYFADPESGEVSEGIDFTAALPGITDEIEMNGTPDFTVGKIPNGAAVSDGTNTALVYRDGTVEKLELPGTIMSVTADKNGELCLYLVNSVAERSVHTLSGGELTLVSDDIPEIKSVAVYKTEESLLMLTETGFYRIADNGEAELIMNFEHSSLVWSDRYNFCVISEGEIYFSGVNDVTDDNGLYKLTPAEDQYRRVIDVLNYSDDALDTFAMLFNSSQSEYFVTGARPQTETASNPDELLGEFDKKLLAGECGDLVCLDSGFDWESYAKQRIFADLSGLFEDGELFDCVTDSLTRNGKLYTVCRSFMINTMYTLDESLSRDALTPTNLIAYSENLPDSSRIFWNMARESVLGSFKNGMSSYIDADSAASGFSCDEFISTLGYISSLPKEYEASGRASSADIYLSGELIFRTKNVFSIETWLDMHRFEADGRQFIETGYPTADGGRAVITPLEYYAIPENADEREGAEDFLRFVLNCHTDAGDMGIPADVTAFRDKTEITKEYYFEYEPGRIDNMSAGRAEWYEPDNENHEPVTDELIAEFEEWLRNIECASPLTSELENIINEEIGAYLDGLCTAEECADRIDSRVGIYLSERE